MRRAAARPPTAAGDARDAEADDDLRDRPRRPREPWNYALDERSLPMIILSTRVDVGDVKLEHQMGAGVFGVVYAGRWRNRRVAVKLLHRHRLAATRKQRSDAPGDEQGALLAAEQRVPGGVNKVAQHGHYIA